MTTTRGISLILTLLLMEKKELKREVLSRRMNSLAYQAMRKVQVPVTMTRMMMMTTTMMMMMMMEVQMMVMVRAKEVERRRKL